MSYHHVTVKDNWGHLIYEVEGEPVTWEDEQIIDVRFPDDFRTRVEVRAVEFSGSVPDMGHEYHYTTTRYEVAIWLHGVEIRIPLQTLEVYR